MLCSDMPLWGRIGLLNISPRLMVTCLKSSTNSIGLRVPESDAGSAGMLLNLQSRYRSATPRSPEGADLLEALHVAGLGSHTACFSATAVRELQAAEFPVDALWTDRIAELDILADALRVRMAKTLSGTCDRKQCAGTPAHPTSICGDTCFQACLHTA